MSYKYQDPNTPVDASLGLIFRLNLLWQRVEEVAVTGNFDAWNARLDRIFCNLLYKNSLDVARDEETGEVTDVKLDNEDQDLWNFLNRNYLNAKKKYDNARTRKEMIEAKEEMYNALIMKDVGLRKFMFKLKLYLKESDRNPARSMFG